MKSSRKLENSLVAFLPELLKKFFGGDIDEATFKREFKDKSCQSKMYLAYMPLSGQELKDARKKFIVEYNAADT